MWNNTANGDTGGGFVNSAMESPAGKPGSEKRRVSQNIVPVTIKQINSCTDEVLKIGDLEVAVMTFIGVVKSVEATSTKITYNIDDHTGVCEAIVYTGTEQDGNEDGTLLLHAGGYGRFVGSIRTDKKTSSKYILVFKAFPLTDLNELTAHLLEVGMVPMKLKKLKEMETMKMNGTFQSNLPNSMIANTNNTSFGGGGGGGGGDANNSTLDDSIKIRGFDNKQAMVFNVLMGAPGETGFHRNHIVDCLKGKMTANDVNATVDFLSSEGHIFSTVDDDHYKITDW